MIASTWGAQVQCHGLQPPHTNTLMTTNYTPPLRLGDASRERDDCERMRCAGAVPGRSKAEVGESPLLDGPAAAGVVPPPALLGRLENPGVWRMRADCTRASEAGLVRSRPCVWGGCRCACECECMYL